MEVINFIGDAQSLTLRQRWAHVFTVLVAIVMLLLGLNLRNNIRTATTPFESAQAGISAEYPRGWLRIASDEHVLRVRDMSRTGYKTTIQVTVRPVGRDTTERNVSERLSLDRAQDFTAYQLLSVEPYTLPNDITGQAITYIYADQTTNPFLEGIPTIVRGYDVLVISGGQAIIITFRADERTFDEDFPRFEQFLRRLTF